MSGGVRTDWTGSHRLKIGAVGLNLTAWWWVFSKIRRNTNLRCYV